MKTSTTLLLALVLSLAGCGGGSSEPAHAEHAEHSGDEHHGEHGHGEHGHHGHGEHGHHHAATPGLGALHDVLAPTWHSEPGATRAALACENAAQLEERAQAVAAEAAPEGRDAAAWTEQTTQLTSSASALVAECSVSGPAVEARLSEFHDAFHVLIER